MYVCVSTPSPPRPRCLLFFFLPVRSCRPKKFDFLSCSADTERQRQTVLIVAGRGSAIFFFCHHQFVIFSQKIKNRPTARRGENRVSAVQSEPQDNGNRRASWRDSLRHHQFSPFPTLSRTVSLDPGLLYSAPPYPVPSHPHQSFKDENLLRSMHRRASLPCLLRRRRRHVPHLRREVRKDEDLFRREKKKET